MEATSTRKEQSTSQPLTRMELLLASLLPVTAILVVGVIGTRWILPDHAAFFIIIFVFCSFVIFLGEYALIASMKRDISRQFSDLMAVCQDYQAGNKQRRAPVHDDQPLTAALAQTLNSLLDFVTHEEQQQVTPQDSGEKKSEQPLKQRLKQLAREVAPVMDADLRQKAAIANGDIGVVIDACNYLIENFAQQITWARHASEQVMNATREIVESSIAFAQATETQMKRLSRTIETGETFVAFLQHLSDILQLSVDLILEMQDRQEISNTEKHPRSPLIVDSTPPTRTLLHHRPGHLDTDIQQQIHLLEDALRAIQENIVIAESMISDLYAFRQRMDHSSSAVLNIAEHIGSLATLAERWRSSVAMFYLPGDAHQDLNNSDMGAIKLSYPS